MRYLFHVSVIVAAGCISDTVSYTPVQDDAAMAVITRVFTAPGAAPLVVSLCEDVAAVEDSNTCQIEHTVRGGGRGRAHEESHGGVGCGGCPLGIAAIIKGTISGGALTAPRMVTGEVHLGYGTSDDDPYAFPYSVTLQCVGTPGCSLSGMLEEDGSLQITFAEGTSPGISTEHALTGGAEASCP